MFDWQTIVAIGALALSAFVVFSRAVDKSLTLREHQEYKSAAAEAVDRQNQQIAEAKRHIEDRVVIREFTDWRDQISRDFDRIEADLRLIDAAKPSTGELQVALKSIETRVSYIEVMIKELRQNDRFPG